MMLLTAGLLAGCGGQKSIPASGGELGYDLIDAGELAGRLGMQLSACTNLTATLRDSQNTVTIMADPGGKIFVNGKVVREGGVFALQGRLLVVGEAEGLIRSSLIHKPTARTYKPLIPRQPPAGRQGITGVIVVDPGHGGKDPGARSASGLREKDLVLDVGLKLAAELQRRGAAVVMTRSDDRFLELDQRAELANRAGADLFISIHADSAPRNRRAQGFTSWIARGASNRSSAAAGALNRSVASAGVNTRGTRQADYRVLVNTNCPAVLVELGFLTNQLDARLLAGDSYRSQLAAALADGIRGYYSSYLASR